MVSSHLGGLFYPIRQLQCAWFLSNFSELRNKAVLFRMVLMFAAFSKILSDESFMTYISLFHRQHYFHLCFRRSAGECCEGMTWCDMWGIERNGGFDGRHDGEIGMAKWMYGWMEVVGNDLTLSWPGLSFRQWKKVSWRSTQSVRMDEWMDEWLGVNLCYCCAGLS